MRTMRSRFPRLLALLLTVSLAGPQLSTSAQDATTPAGPEVIVGTHLLGAAALTAAHAAFFHLTRAGAEQA